MLHKLEIREYRAADKSFVIEILKLNTPKYFAESEIDDLDHYLENKVEVYLVVELQGKIIGAGGINFDCENRSAMLSWDFISPEYQGNGVGQKLLKYRIDLLKTMEDIDHIKVRTSQLAYKFYTKNRFQTQSIVYDYWAKGLDLYQMKYE